jgi:hypothetical protein
MSINYDIAQRAGLPTRLPAGSHGLVEFAQQSWHISRDGGLQLSKSIDPAYRDSCFPGAFAGACGTFGAFIAA